MYYTVLETYRNKNTFENTKKLKFNSVILIRYMRFGTFIFGRAYINLGTVFKKVSDICLSHII